MMYSAYKLPKGADQLSLDPADYPACKLWTRLLEATKVNTTVLADLTGTVNDISVVANGAANPDATAQALNCDLTASNECYARNSSALDAALATLGDNSVMIECDIDLTSGDHTAGFVEIGNPFDGTDGYSLAWNSSGYPAARMGGASASSTLYNFSTCPSLTGSRAHLLLVWERSSTDTIGTVSLYLNGAFVESGALSADPGAIEINTNGRVSLGSRAGSVLSNLDGDMYNARVWVVSAIPSNIDTIAAQMANNPDEFPPLMNGVS